MRKAKYVVYARTETGISEISVHKRIERANNQVRTRSSNDLRNPNKSTSYFINPEKRDDIGKKRNPRR